MALGEALAKRGELKASDGLGHLAGSAYPTLNKEGMRLLSLWMQARTAQEARELLQHEFAQVRLMAGRRLIHLKDKRSVEALALLKDPVQQVREGLHGELIRIAGKDLANPGKSKAEQEAAFRVWVDWWKQQAVE